MNQIVDPEIFRFLTLSLAPVLIVGVGILVIKISRNTQKKTGQK